ncbi:MAG: nitroreductase family protein [Candidatus Woesearchaeota archaeon]
MDALEAIRTRRSIRKFSAEPLDFDVVTAIIEAGHMAPSTGGLEARRFILCTDPHVIHGLKQFCMDQECFNTAQAIVVVCALPEKVEAWYGPKGENVYSAHDAAAATENMLLAAHNLGLGAVWVGGFDDEKIKAIFSIPSKSKAHAIVCLGFPAEVPSPKTTTPLQAVVYFNQYGNKIKNMHVVLRDYSLAIKAAMPEIEMKPIESRNVLSGLKKGVKNVKKSFFPPPKKGA